MAWQSLGYELRIRVVDAGNNEVTKTYAMTTVVHADALTEAIVILNALEAVSLLSSKTYTINEAFYNDAFALPAAGVQAEARAVLVGPDGTLPNKMHRTEIPGPDTTVFLATQGEGANIVDITDAGVLAYWALFDTAGEAYLSDGESVAVAGLLKGYRRTVGKKHG